VNTFQFAFDSNASNIFKFMMKKMIEIDENSDPREPYMKSSYANRCLILEAPFLSREEKL